METISIVFLEEEDSDTSGESLKELCKSLQRSTVQLAETVNTRAHMRKWLEAHGLTERSSYADFFDVVLNELSQENRLDLSARTLCPTAQLAALLKIPKDKPIHIIDFLALAPTLFH